MSLRISGIAYTDAIEIVIFKRLQLYRYWYVFALWIIGVALDQNLAEVIRSIKVTLQFL